MFFKLLKYEFKATYKFFVGVMGLFLAFIVPVVLACDVNTDSVVLQLIKVGVFALFFFGYFLVAVIAMTGVVIYAILRFHKSLLGTEGYLTHTLPVSTGSLIITKNITMVIWAVLINGFIISVMLWILFHSNDVGISTLINDPKFRDGVMDFIHNLPSYLPSLFSLFVFLLLPLVMLSEQIMTIYAAMAVGYSFKKGRKLKSFIVYILMQYVVGTLTGWISSFTEYIGSISAFSFLDLSSSENYILLIFFTAVIVVMFFITRYFLKNRLNLQ